MSNDITQTQTITVDATQNNVTANYTLSGNAYQFNLTGAPIGQIFLNADFTNPHVTFSEQITSGGSGTNPLTVQHLNFVNQVTFPDVYTVGDGNIINITAKEVTNDGMVFISGSATINANRIDGTGIWEAGNSTITVNSGDRQRPAGGRHAVAGAHIKAPGPSRESAPNIEPLA